MWKRNVIFNNNQHILNASYTSGESKGGGGCPRGPPTPKFRDVTSKMALLLMDVTNLTNVPLHDVDGLRFPLPNGFNGSATVFCYMTLDI